MVKESIIKVPKYKNSSVEKELNTKGVPFYGRRLMLLRATKGISRGELADALGVGYAQIGMWEGENVCVGSLGSVKNTILHKYATPSKPTPTMLDRICKYFDISPSFFFNEDWEKKLNIKFKGNIPVITEWEVEI